MPKKRQWQIDEETRLDRLSTEALIAETIGMAAGDDWDGCFTKRGEIAFEAAQRLIDERMKRIVDFIEGVADTYRGHEGAEVDDDMCLASETCFRCSAQRLLKEIKGTTE